MDITKRRARRGIASLATAYAAAEGTEEEFVIPEDLSVLSDEDLATFRETAVGHFQALYGDGSGLTDEDMAVLALLGEGITSLNTETEARATLAAERSTAAGELAASLGLAPVVDAEVTELTAEGEELAAEEPVDETAASDAEAVDAVVASATDTRPKNIRVPLGSMRNRSAARPAPAQSVVAAGAPKGMRDLVFSSDAPGLKDGTAMDFEAIGAAVDRRLNSFNQSLYASAAGRGAHMREQLGIAVFRKPFAKEQIVSDSNPDSVENAIRFAIDETRLKGGSLVASGGWCAPSEVLYDFLELESRDGLLSLPEIAVTRGGIMFTPGPTFADIYSATGFCFTEQDDIDGTYDSTPPAGIAFPATTAVQVGQVINSGSGIKLQVTTAGTTAGTAPTAPAAVGGTVTSGTAVLTRVSGASGNVLGDKPCYHIECPEFEEARLDVCGICLTAGLLQQRGYPEIIARTVRGALIAHDHRMSARLIQALVAGSTAVSLPANQVGTLAPILSAIELQTEHVRYTHRLSRATTLEAIFPFWVRGAIRSDLSRRLGVDLIDVTDARIDGWFRSRGISPQFVYDWQALDTTAATAFNAWPTSVQFLLYPAGTWVRGSSDVITLDTIYDSVNLAQNDFTALFTEEGWFAAKRGHDSRIVTVPIAADGATAAGVDILHNGAAA